MRTGIKAEARAVKAEVAGKRSTPARRRVCAGLTRRAAAGVFMLVLCTTALIQNGEAQTRAADSLKALLNKAKTLRQKTDLQAALAREVFMRDRGAACSYAEEALRSAEAAGYRRGMGRALLEKAWCSFFMKDYMAAERNFTRAVETSKAARDAETTARALVGGAWIAKNSKNSAEISSRLERALTVCIESRDALTAKYVLGQASSVYRTLTDDGTVLRLQRIFLQAAERRRDTASIVYALRLIGNSHYAASAWKQAVDAYERCAELGRAQPYSNDVPQALNMAGNAYVTLGSLPEAVNAFERGYNAAEEGSDLRWMAYLSRNLARMHTMRGDYTQSMSCLRRSLDFAVQLGDTSFIAGFYFLLGIEHDFAGKKEEALPYFQKCVELRRSLGDVIGVSQALELMGAICTNKGDYERAVPYLEESLRVADSIGHPESQALARIGIGRNHRDKGELRTAVEYFKQALSIYRQIHGSRDELNTLEKIGSTLSMLGIYDSASMYLDTAYVLADRRASKWAIQYIDEAQAKHRARMGDYQTALKLLRKVDASQDSTYDEENLRKTNELSARYENERKEKRIADLEKQKLMTEVELKQRKAESERRRLLLLSSGQELGMIERENRIRDLMLESSRSELALKASAVALIEARNEEARREDELRAARFDSELFWKGGVIFASFLLLVGAGFAAKSQRDKKRAVALRAENALYRARAAELQAHRIRSEGQRRERERQEAFLERLMKAQEQERERIAGILHDGVGRELISVKENALVTLNAQNVETKNIDEILRIASSALEDVRMMSRSLRPVQLERLGLTASLRSMISAISENTGLRIDSQLDDIDGLLPSENEIDLYRVLQEALNNSAAHAKAENVGIFVRHDGLSITLTVRDDGIGFDPACLIAGSTLGLHGMNERIGMLGGELKIDSGPGRGTVLHACVPVAPARAGTRVNIRDENDKKMDRDNRPCASTQERI